MPFCSPDPICLIGKSQRKTRKAVIPCVHPGSTRQFEKENTQAQPKAQVSLLPAGLLDRVVLPIHTAQSGQSNINS